MGVCVCVCGCVEGVWVWVVLVCVGCEGVVWVERREVCVCRWVSEGE